MFKIAALMNIFWKEKYFSAFWRECPDTRCRYLYRFENGGAIFCIKVFSMKNHCHRACPPSGLKIPSCTKVSFLRACTVLLCARADNGGLTVQNHSPVQSAAICYYMYMYMYLFKHLLILNAFKLLLSKCFCCLLELHSIC